MRSLATATALALLLGTASHAVLDQASAATLSQQPSEKEEERRQNQTLQPRTGEELNEALNFANEDPPQLAQALEILNRLMQRDLPPYDRSTVLEIRAGVRYGLDQQEGSIQDYAEILRIDVLPFERINQIRRNVAQLYFQDEQYDQAIRYMQEFIAANPTEATANDYFIIAAAHATQDQFRPALEPAQQALQRDQKREKRFYDMLNLIYSELNMSAERGELLETMVEYFPQEVSYWAQLSGSYSSAGRDRDAFATLEAAYRAGLIRDEPKIVALAQFYYQLENPYRGAEMLSEEMNAGTVKRNLNNLKLLSQLWAAAREQSEAIEILTEAAPQSDRGDLYYQLGQSYVADEQFAEGIEALRAALRKGGLGDREEGNIHLLIGSSYFSIDSDTAEGRRNARQAYQQALRYSSAASSARQYIDYIDAIIDTERRQDEVERIQAVERQQRQIDRCETILDIVDLGGSSGSPDEDIQACRDLQEQVDAGATAESLVQAERNGTSATPAQEEAEAPDAG